MPEIISGAHSKAFKSECQASVPMFIQLMLGIGCKGNNVGETLVITEL